MTDETFLTVAEGCALLRVQPRALYAAIRRGEYAAVRLPSGALRLPRRELEAVLAAGRVVPQREPAKVSADV